MESEVAIWSHVCVCVVCVCTWCVTFCGLRWWYGQSHCDDDYICRCASLQWHHVLCMYSVTISFFLLVIYSLLCVHRCPATATSHQPFLHVHLPLSVCIAEFLAKCCCYSNDWNHRDQYGNCKPHNYFSLMVTFVVSWSTVDSGCKHMCL